MQKKGLEIEEGEEWEEGAEYGNEVVKWSKYIMYVYHN